ncbi:MAG: hypothetical protein LWX83_08925, partial [Anaerolineae bacterium]|nr:hypothetical protein [Anaerolineae bacterium]
VTAGLGMLFCMAGLYLVWFYSPVVTKTVLENLDVFLQSVTTTEAGLTAVQESILTIQDDALALKRVTGVLSQGILDSEPILDSFSQLTGEDLPDTIHATQNSLAAAEKSAKLMDDMMTSLASIPFSPVKAYKPEIPLHTALGQISQNLDDIPDSLKTINLSLKDSRKNFDAMQTELDQLAGSMDTINKNLSNAGEVINQYHQSTLLLKERITTARNSAAGVIQNLVWFLTFLLVWFFIIQWGVLLYALDMQRAVSNFREVKNKFTGEDHPKADQ